ncbi:MAG: sulfatase-like hydrolase/transferase [Planctomycetota bacterium]|jgi:arylsulfatase A-like enzyme
MLPLALALLLPIIPSCKKPAEPGPNVLFVVWDTVRADRMSLYGYDKSTTPFLDEWARKGRVFDRCISPGSSTVPAHGAMFTGLLPSEHGANNRHKNLDDRHETLAEIFKRGGYDTYLFSANPHISKDENFDQGFDQANHPWDRKNRQRALKIVRNRLHPEDRSNELVQEIRRKKVNKWFIKAAGQLGRENLIGWLEQRESDKPFFAFLNYMEAHQPYVPREKYRKLFMTPGQIELSYKEDFSWMEIWTYTFGLKEYSPEALEVLGLVYDACIAELDDLFKDLISSLEERGLLENTIVVLTGDHGEHLGEHHMIDHQFSLYEELLEVPLVLWYPGKVEPGRENMPVVNYDLFPTLLDLAGLEAGARRAGHAINLLEPRENRLRMAEYPSDFEFAIQTVKQRFPDWDPNAFRKRLFALYQGDLKLIWASNGMHELYDLNVDPQEQNNLVEGDHPGFAPMQEALEKVKAGLDHFDYSKAQKPRMSEEQQKRLEALGYADGGHR